jgi:DNA-binding NarL/FixJ family response regulator
MPMADHHHSPDRFVVLDRRVRLRAGDADAKQIRVLLADRMGRPRAWLRALLEGEPDIAIAGEAATGEEILAVASEQQVDVILMDVGLPGLDGVEAVRRIVSEPDVSHIPVLVLGRAPREDDLRGYLQAGARGILVEDIEASELLRAVRVVAGGGTHLSTSVTTRVIEQFASLPNVQPFPPASFEELTAREREIVALAAHGLNNAEIAERLTLSPATAKTHISRAMVKLHIRDRAKLVALAYQTGFVQPPHQAADTPPPSATLSPAF